MRARFCLITSKKAKFKFKKRNVNYVTHLYIHGVTHITVGTYMW